MGFRSTLLKEEEKEDKQEGFPRPSIKRAGSIGQNQKRSVQNNPSATLSISNQFPQAPIAGEQELFVNSAGESLPALKAQY